LPPPNNFEALVTQPGITEAHFTTDSDGNVLAPVDWSGVLLRSLGVPIPRLVRTAISLEAFLGGGAPVVLPGDEFVASYSPEGIILPPVFAPLADPDSADTTLFGSTDAVRSVIRVIRQGCAGGDNAGLACTMDGECPGGTCSPVLFDFGDRYTQGVGPVALAGGMAGDYEAFSQSPVPLDGLVESDETFAFVVWEAADGVDRNGDGDQTDFVLSLRSRETGALTTIGAGGIEGRAVTRVRPLPFSFPAVVTEGDLAVYLEAEPLQDHTDLNGDDDRFDTILRAFRLGNSNDLTGQNLAVAADPIVDGQSVALSGELAYYRVPEWVGGARTTRMLSVSGANVKQDGELPAISADGSVIAFVSDSPNLDPPDAVAGSEPYAFHRTTDVIERVNVDSNENEGDAGVTSFSPPDVTDDGRYVAFVSDASDLTLVDGPIRDIFVRDLVGGTTSIASLAFDGGTWAGVTPPFNPGISGDGTVAVFASEAIDFVANPPGTPFSAQTFARDLVAPTTELVSSDAMGGFASSGSSSGAGRVSRDGRFVAFTSSATDLVPPVTGRHVFLRDREAGTTEVVTLSNLGAPITHLDGFSPLNEISGDANRVVFWSDAVDAVPGDNNSGFDAFVRDRAAATTIRASVASDGSEQGDAGVFGLTAPFVSMSQDGRYVSFASSADDVVPGDTNSQRDIFVHDILTGFTERASIRTGGIVQGNGGSQESSISQDGRFVAFSSVATNLDPSVTPSAAAVSVYLHGVEEAGNGAFDANLDGALDDTLLEVMDLRGGPVSRIRLGPASRVEVEGGRVAFLRPEDPSELVVGSLNSADGDLTDQVVHLWERTCVGGMDAGDVCASDADCDGGTCGVPVPTCSGGALNGSPCDSLGACVFLGGTGCTNLANLDRAGSEIALSPAYLAALVPEADEGGSELNGDMPSDAADEVVHVYDLTADTWANVGTAGEALAIRGANVAFLTSEQAQGEADETDDGDTADRYIQLYDAATDTLETIQDLQGRRQPAEHLVLGDQLLTFSTPEIGFCDAAVTGTCESAPGCTSTGECDLNGDGDCCDTVLQVHDLADDTLTNTGQTVQACRLVECDPRKPWRVFQDTVRFLLLESDMTGPLQPVADFNDDGDSVDLLVRFFNARTGITTLAAEVADTGATVQSGQAAGDPLGDPTQSSEDPRFQSFLSRGLCVEDTNNPCGGGCPTGQFCFEDPDDGPPGTCAYWQGTCDTDADCPPGGLCIQDLISMGVVDSDLDEVPDPVDNCPEAANVTQADADGDGVGDVCDLQTCGDGNQQLAEECDDGDLDDDDGCDSNCRITGCGNGIVTAGEVCDDGNQIDGDGCEATCTVSLGGMPQDRDQQRCINTLNKGFAKVAKAAGKDTFRCLKSFATGKTGDLGLSATIEGCVVDDVTGRVTQAQDKNIEKAADKCAQAPTIAATDAATGNAAAVTGALDLVHDLFGPDLDDTVLTLAADREVSQCQQTVLKQGLKCQKDRLKEFNKCKKLGLKGKVGPAGAMLPFGRASDVGLCLRDDPKGKVAGACGSKLEAKLLQQCDELDALELGDAAPGCGAADTASLQACVAARVACRACLALKETDALTIGCDAVDNDAFDGSCP
jgi:cysteine-rich repeat protein